MKKLIAILFTCALIANLASANSARDVLDAAGVKGGFVVHIGCGGPEASVRTAELHSNDRFLVHGLSRNPDHVAASRKHIQSLGLYRPVSVDRWEGQALPYGDNMINLIVMEDGSQVPEAEILRTGAKGCCHGSACRQIEEDGQALAGRDGRMDSLLSRSGWKSGGR